jgi:O-antigen/teichoic acid export membrane protein
MFQSNMIIVAQIINAEAVTTFAIADRLFGLITFAIGLMLMPLWPAYGEALASLDTDWIRQNFRRSLLASIVVSIIMSGGALLFGPTLIRWWVGEAILVPFSVLLGFAVWKVMEAIGNAVAILLNGLNEIRSQAILAVFNAAANLTLKIWLVGEFGLPGVMLATILAYSVFALPWLVWLVRSALLRMDGCS